MFVELFKDIDRALAQAKEVLKSREVEASGRILVGLSGGADSCALLHCLKRHLGQQYRIHALHANHQLHPNAQSWADHCQQLCRELEVPFTLQTLSVDTKGNLEAAARRVRYEFFARHMESGDVLMLAHHGQDQVETVLMRIFQGRGMLPMRRHGPLGPGLFIRPFLAQHKSRLVDYLRAHHVAWVDDPSNSDTMLDRNFLRTQVLPQVRQRWPSYAHGVQRSVDDLSAQRALLMHYVGQAGDETPFQQIPQATELAVVWLRGYLAHRGQFGVSDAALHELLRQRQDSDRGYLDLGSACLRIWRDKLYFEPVSESGEKWLSEISATVPMQVLWNKYKLDLAPATAGEVDAVAYVGGLRVTCRDSLNALPAGVADRLKRRFQFAGIPPWRRGQYPLLWDDIGLFCIPQIWQRADTQLSAVQTCKYCVVRSAPNSD